MADRIDDDSSDKPLALDYARREYGRVPFMSIAALISATAGAGFLALAVVDPVFEAPSPWGDVSIIAAIIATGLAWTARRRGGGRGLANLAFGIGIPVLVIWAALYCFAKLA